MKGPESFAEGEFMATRTEVPLWNEDDIEIARKFLEASHTLQGNFVEKKDLAAEAIGFSGGYRAMTPGSRSYISHLGQVAKKERNNERIAERVAHNLKQMEKDWVEQYKNDPSFHHAMTHPDDEDEKYKV